MKKEEKGRRRKAKKEREERRKKEKGENARVNEYILPFVADGMFKGIYHGKQYHVTDLKSVLERAWCAGVDRIIVSILSKPRSLNLLKNICHTVVD